MIFETVGSAESGWDGLVPCVIGGHFSLGMERQIAVMVVFIGGKGKGTSKGGAGKTAGIVIGDG